MVTEWGMSDRIGPLFYGSEGEILSEETIDGKRLQRRSGKHYRRRSACHCGNVPQACFELLSKHTDILHNMARVLIERETIHTEEVQMLMEGKTAEEVMQFMDRKENAAAHNSTTTNTQMPSDTQPTQQAQNANTNTPSANDSANN